MFSQLQTKQQIEILSDFCFFQSKQYFRQHLFQNIMKHILTLSAVAILFVVISSCGKTPSACFEVKNGIDSVYVYVPTLFDASCTKDATQFKWKFSDQPDSIYYSPQVYHTYDSIDTFKVSLTAILGGRENVQEKTIIVKTP
jgi:PKD repeat protein